MTKIDALRSGIANRLVEDFDIPKKSCYEIVDTVLEEIRRELEATLRLRSKCEISGLGFFRKMDLSGMNRRDFFSTRILFSPAKNVKKYNKY